MPWALLCISVDICLRGMHATTGIVGVELGHLDYVLA